MTKKSAIETVKDYLKTKRIRYEASTPNALWFSLLVPTPEIRETPNRFVSCGFSIQEGNRNLLLFSATIMIVDISGVTPEGVSSLLMKFQSSDLKAGKITLHCDGTVSYALTQFLCSGGTIDMPALANMMTTAILEIASIFMIRVNALKVLPMANVTRFGIA
jgi:hypothetical protein